MTGTFTESVLNRTTNTFDPRTTITNTSQEPLREPLSVVVTSVRTPQVQLADATSHLADGTPFVAVTLPDDTLTRPTEVGLTLNSQPAEGASTSGSLPGQPMQDLGLTTAAMGSNTLIDWYKPVNTHRPAEMPVPPLRRSKRSRPARSADTVALVNALIDWDETKRLTSPETSCSAAPQSGERKPNEAWS